MLVDRFVSRENEDLLEENLKQIILDIGLENFRTIINEFNSNILNSLNSSMENYLLEVRKLFEEKIQISKECVNKNTFYKDNIFNVIKNSRHCICKVSSNSEESVKMYYLHGKNVALFDNK